MSIVVAGSIALDDVMTGTGSVNDAPGGSALYFSAAASIFAPVRLISIAGEDFPREEIEFLKSRQVNLDGLKVIKGGKTFRWGTRYEPDMNMRTTIRRELNVSLDFNPLLDETCRKADYIFLANMEPELQMKVLNQAERPRLIAMDTMECYIKSDLAGLKAVMQRVNLLFINDSEVRLVTGMSGLLKASRELLKIGPQYVIVKKGVNGSMLVSDERFFTVPAYPVERVVDPTGAGDTYAGGAMGYLAKTDSNSPEDIIKAVVYGGIAASFCVEDFSINALKKITLADVEKRMKHFRSITSF